MPFYWSNATSHRGHKLITDPDTLASVRNLIQQILPRGRGLASEAGHSSYTQSFLRMDGADSPTYQAPQRASPPLFARDRNPGATYHLDNAGSISAGLGELEDLGSLVQTAGELDDQGPNDLYTEHMVIVSGWGEYMRICTGQFADKLSQKNSTHPLRQHSLLIRHPAKMRRSLK